ncbi:hypothetical protein DN752_14565 [Echinicola strongylocentroti]|uniref:DUF4382 domain-containing protein n=1 Tax=Echinicola strongylocentroti TaxID=1795355 RepID=A0A2Z4IL07_9BACT|nr:hypothetical protein [Echinicola strongylocentroti]AWW31248.1 hypothetical protein DN752_14565 [Echinicola strongylocentroti]
MKKQLLVIGLFTAGTLGLFSCNNEDQDEMPNATVNVKARAIAENSSLEEEQPVENARTISGANIISTALSIGNISLHGGDEGAASVQLPLEGDASIGLSLLESALPLTKTIGTVTLNPGEYADITLQLQQDTALTETDAMYEKTLKIDGNVNNQLMTFHTNTEEMLTAAAQSGSISITGNQDIYLNVDINRLLENVDLTLAMDGNGNGTIEIEPNNLDGNRDIYLTIIGNLEKALYISGE